MSCSGLGKNMRKQSSVEWGEGRLPGYEEPLHLAWLGQVRPAHLVFAWSGSVGEENNTLGTQIPFPRHQSYASLHEHTWPT